MTKPTALLVGLVALGASPAVAHGNPRGEARAALGGKAVAIEYGRPSLNGRDMLGKAPVGNTWRMGADAPTTLKTDVDLVFGSAVVPKGDYLLTATRTTEDLWTLNVEKRDPASPRAPGSKVAEIPLTGATLPQSVEVFTIELRAEKDAGAFEMKWGTTALKAAFTAR